MNHIIIDYDSTFIKIESLDLLSKISSNSDEKTHKKISEITRLGMEGKISFSESLRKRIELMFPTQNKIELFSRDITPGWDVWGNEV